jgi:predicted short-subunit dehydrogenase-like oxidoreductase (DUF2520 family)
MDDLMDNNMNVSLNMKNSMSIGIIGAGRLGCSFALALADKGFKIAGVSSRNPESAGYICERLGIGGNGVLDYRALVLLSDIVLITVPDSEIPYISRQIAEVCSKEEIYGRIFMHCSGAAVSSLLKPLADKGAFTGSLHPAQTFPDRENSWRNLHNIYFGFEGSKEAEEASSILAESLDGTLLRIEAEAKPLYHAAACVISNYTAALAQLTGDLLQAAGLDREAGMKAFSPLFTSTVKNILEMGSVKALTGPISRGDTVTVKEHLEAMGRQFSQNCDLETVELYKTLGRAATRLAAIKGTIDDEKAAELTKLLS